MPTSNLWTLLRSASMTVIAEMPHLNRELDLIPHRGVLSALTYATTMVSLRTEHFPSFYMFNNHRIWLAIAVSLRSALSASFTEVVHVEKGL